MGIGRNQVSASLPRIYPTYFSQFDFGVFISICRIGSIFHHAFCRNKDNPRLDATFCRIKTSCNSQFVYGRSVFAFFCHSLWRFYYFFFLFCIFLPTLFCRLSVVWIDSCTGRTKYKNEKTKPDNQNTNKTYQTAKQKFGLLVVWLFAVRKNGRGTEK